MTLQEFINRYLCASQLITVFLYSEDIGITKCICHEVRCDNFIRSQWVIYADREVASVEPVCTTKGVLAIWLYQGLENV